MVNKQDFLLNGKVRFFNNGSYGACPRKVFKKYQEWQRIIEFQPVEFYQKTLLPELKKSRQLIADHINAQENDITLIRNATYAVNLVIRSLELTESDEVLLTDHEYGACLNAWNFWQQEKGFKLNTIKIDLPLPSDKDLIKSIESQLTPRTKVIFFSHISSFTAQLFPAGKICALAKKHGIISVVDGAHSIGQIKLDMQKIKGDFYFSNLHKWFFSPKGTAFLYAHPSLQKSVRPLITGWGWGKNRELQSGNDYIDSNQFYGTSDLSSFLSIPAAFKYYKEYDIAENKKNCNRLVKYFLQEMHRITGLPPLYDDHPPELMMGVVEIPPRYRAIELKNILYEKYRIEVPVIEWKDKMMIRISIQIYNSREEVDYFLEIMEKLFT